MSKLIEVSEFNESVLRIDADTLVKGYDGNELGPANEQAQVLANRTKYLKEKLEEVLTQLGELGGKEYVASINEKSGIVTISYSDIGAAALKHTHPTTDIKTSDEASFVSKEEKTKWDSKQTFLESGKNINTLHGKSLLGSEDIKLDYSDVNADKAGTADSKIADHIASQDPHTQYLTEAKGSNVFVIKTDGNKPNGYLKLDENGYIPSELSTLYEARYKIVDNKEERLLIEQSKNLTMALQLDENRIYYLDSGVDPSVNENWKAGRSTELSDVISVFNRSGIVTAENGDYNADQITETENRVFVSPSEKVNWEGKQDKLNSGTTIKTINNESILGEGDLIISPESIGAAEKLHTHDVDEIKTNDSKQFISVNDRNKWDGKQDKLVSNESIKTINKETILGSGDIEITPESIGAASVEHKHLPSDIITDDNSQFISKDEKLIYSAKQDKLVAGKNIANVFGYSLLDNEDITFDPKIVASVIKGGDGIKVTPTEDGVVITNLGSDGVKWKIQQLDKASKGDHYFFKLNDEDYNRYLLHFPYRYFNIEKYKEDQTRSYSGNVLSNLLKNETLYSDNKDKITCVEPYSIELETENTPNSNEDIKYYSTDKVNVGSSPITVEKIRVAVGIEATSAVIKTFSSYRDETNYGYKLFSVGDYPDYDPWLLFSAPIAENLLNKVPAKTYWSAAKSFDSYGTEIYVGIILDKPIMVHGYMIQRMNEFALSTSTLLKSWRLEASEDVNTGQYGWTSVDAQTDVDLSFSEGDDPFKVFALDSVMGPFRSFRIRITNVIDVSGRPSIPRFNVISSSPMLLEDKENKNNYITFDSKSNIIKVDNNENKDIKTLIDSKGFFDSGELSIDALKDINNYNLVSSGKTKALIYRYGRKIQLRVDPNIEQDKLALININKIGPIIPDKSSFNAKVALITDQDTWYVFKDSKWTVLSIPEDINSSYDKLAEVIYDNGMTVEDFNNIPEKSFVEFIYNMTGVFPSVSIAYAVYNTSTNESVTPKGLNISYGGDKGWEPVDSNSIKIKIINGRMIISIKEDGDYKLLYNFIDN